MISVLFLCTGNSARSILAETILNRSSDRRFRASSAGSFPKREVHPAALKLLKSRGYTVDQLRSTIVSGAGSRDDAKRWLREHVQSGYPLVQGTVIMFIISEGFLDTHGAKLKSSQKITYKIGPPERRLVEIKNWQYHYPSIDSLEPITVEFDRPLDHALIQRCICIKDNSGHEVHGYSQAGSEERSWQFFPQIPWSIGRYTIIIEDILEDLAGNSIKRIFDRELLDNQSVHDIPVTSHSFCPKVPRTKASNSCSNMINIF